MNNGVDLVKSKLKKFNIEQLEQLLILEGKKVMKLKEILSSKEN